MDALLKFLEYANDTVLMQKTLFSIFFLIVSSHEISLSSQLLFFGMLILTETLKIIY